MLVAPTYNGVELPVHDSETLVATAEDLWSSRRFQDEILQDGTAPTFVRAMMIGLGDHDHAPRSLPDLLEKTDRELEGIAELCGALVVSHEWGLYPVHGKDFTFTKYLPSAHGIDAIVKLPEDHILVAEVETIQAPRLEAKKQPADSAAATQRRVSIRAGLHQYYDEGKGSYQLEDMRRGRGCYRVGQFLWGVPASSPSDGPEAHLIDIEPRFALTR